MKFAHGSLERNALERLYNEEITVAKCIKLLHEAEQVQRLRHTSADWMYQPVGDEKVAETAGNARALYYETGIHSCGAIKDGVSFRLAGEGPWVISLACLKQIVAEAEEERRRIEESTTGGAR